MADWTVDTLLGMTQDLLGEPRGSFYNIGARLQYFNTVQNQLVEDTRALTTDASLSTTAGTQTVAVPSDFLQFAQAQPIYYDGTDYYPLTVLSVHDVEKLYPDWKDTVKYTNIGSPEVIFRTSSDFNLLPVPNGGSLLLTYVKKPTALSLDTDVPFDGVEDYNRFAPALAYKTASYLTMAHNPQYASMLNNIYMKERASFMSHIRRSPQQPVFIKPVTRRGTVPLSKQISNWRNS